MYTKQEKIARLKVLLKEYVKHLRAYSSVSVTVFKATTKLEAVSSLVKNQYGEEETLLDIKEVQIPETEYVRISYKEKKISFYDSYSIEFPMEDIDKRILHYKQKLKTLLEKEKSL